jgi:hypothetical protein
MYTDLRADPDRVQTPGSVVRTTAARDCIRLAGSTLAYAHRYVKEKLPFAVTSAHDRLFTMKSSKLQQMLNTPDFWWYYISCAEKGHQDIAEAILGYERDHINTNTQFLPAQ